MPRYKGGLSDRPDFDLITPPIKTRKVSQKTKPDGSREVSHTIEHDTQAKAHTIKALKDSRPRKSFDQRLMEHGAFEGSGQTERPAPLNSDLEGGQGYSSDAGDQERFFNQSFGNNLWRAPDEWDADPMRMISNRTDPMLERIRNISSVDEANQLIHMMRSSRMRSA